MFRCLLHSLKNGTQEAPRGMTCKMKTQIETKNSLQKERDATRGEAREQCYGKSGVVKVFLSLAQYSYSSREEPKTPTRHLPLQEMQRTKTVSLRQKYQVLAGSREYLPTMDQE